MSKARQLREILRREKMLVAPGAYDCITARMVEQAGFSAVYMTGAGTAATLGYPDYGLVTMSEMAENAGRITACTSVPVIADADTGYGNELNVVRTIREYEKRGVAGLHMEDQGFPKKCGHLNDKTVIPLEEYVSKIRAAVGARQDPDFLLIARTDARAVNGFEDAIARANAALEAGADMAFVEAAQTMEEVAAIPKRVKGPCLFNLVWRGKTPDVPLGDAEAMGYKLTILPGVLFKAVIGVCDETLKQVREQRRHPKPATDLPVHEVFRRVGAAEWDELNARFRPPAPAKAAAE